MCDRIFRDAYDRGARRVTNEINRFNAPCHNAGSGWPQYLDLIEQFERIRVSDGLNAPERMQLEWMIGRVPYLRADRGVPDLYDLEAKAIAALAGNTTVTARDQRTNARNSQFSGNPRTAAARDLFERASAGDAEAQYEYARLLYSGEGVTRDDEAVTYWVSQAAYQNHVPAQVTFAQRLYHGLGRRADHSQAYYWADKAAQKGAPGGFYWRALLAWPASNPDLFLQMLADSRGKGLFNFPQALADLDRADAACQSQDSGWCELVDDARREMLGSSRGQANPTDEDWAEINRRNYQQQQDDFNRQNIFDADAMGMFCC